jgi:Domain of unknown function (DUF5655)/Domain of unknown function (DUF4287)
MADPQAALLNQLHNIQTRTGKAITELHDALATTGLQKHGEKRTWLMAKFKLGYGDANTVALMVGKLPADLGGRSEPAGQADPLDALYTGPKAPLRPLHEAVMALVKGFGPFEEAPKKTYISLRRNKQFAMVGPATKDAIEIGLNAKDLPAHERLKPLPPGGMCQATTRLSAAEEVDASLKAWLKQAYDAAA